MSYGRSHLHKHPHSFEKHRPDPVGLVPEGERSFLEYSGRPNITGYLNAANLGNVPIEFVEPATGALRVDRYSTGKAVPDIDQSTQKAVNDFSFNATLSSAIYGGATTVQTASLRAYTLIRYA